MSQVKQVYRKYNVDSRDTRIIELRKVLGNKMGYFGKMAKWVFEDDVPISEIELIMNSLQNIRISKPIHEFTYIEELSDYIRDTQNKRKLNQIIKSIPSKSRRNVSTRIKELIYSNIEREDEIRGFLSKKGGSCKTEDELYQRISEVINLSGQNTSYKAVIRRIKVRLLILKVLGIINLLSWIRNGSRNRIKHGEIVYKDGKNIILKVNTYTLSRLLGSPHWCISTSKYYWDMYVPKDGVNNQYFIFQTEHKDKKSMVGVTVTPGDTNKHIHFRDDTKCNDVSYLDKYDKYLRGTKLVIKTWVDLVEYKISDLNIILNTPDWFNLITGTYVGDRRYYYGTTHQIRINDGGYLSWLINEVYTNRHRYEYDDYCKFMHRVSRTTMIRDIKTVSIFSKIDYDAPYFDDDNVSMCVLGFFKIVYFFYTKGHYQILDVLDVKMGRNKIIGINRLSEYTINDISDIIPDGAKLFTNSQWDTLGSTEKINTINELIKWYLSSFSGTYVEII